jgi:aldehyde dehydrogenase (NAD+)
MSEKTLLHQTAALLGDFGIAAETLTNGDLPVASPIDGSRIATIRRHGRNDLDGMIAAAERAFLRWREVPAPRRGELVRLFAEQLRRHKEALGRLVSIEAGKILEEGQGEVQEMIDICDFAVGLSRQLYGRVIASERPGHRMIESWHPLGPVGIITAFNFPVAVWSWNAAIALVCGDPLIWKPSDKTPLCSLACNALLGRAIERFGMPDELPRGLSQGRDRRRRTRRGAGRRPAPAAGQRHRVHPHGRHGWAASGAALRPHPPRTRRQQRHDRRALGRS